MNIHSRLNPPPLFVEIGPSWLRARRGGESVALPLERSPDGRLTAPGKEKTTTALKDFLKAKSWLPRARAWCAISSRGVSLRKLSLPGGTPAEFHQRLLLQIEAEFPLPPDELAWGCQPLHPPQPANGVLARQELLVAAVKKELLADYHEILHGCGTEPVFTLASMARWHYCGQPTDSFAMLDVGEHQSELTIFEHALPAVSRIIFWDAKNAANPGTEALAALATNLKGSLPGLRLFVSGQDISKEFTDRLAWCLGPGCKCERAGVAPADGGSAAVCGLEKLAAQGGAPELAIRLEPASNAATSWADLDWKTWGARVAVLAAACLLLPYVEALLLKPHLEQKVAAFKTEAARLKVIDRELEFLRGLKLSQPPYLDLLSVFAKSVPPGTRFDALSMNSHGEVALRAAFRDGQQVADFRNKLIASGFFTNVVVEEQVPTPDRQKVNVRLSAQEKSAAELQLASARMVVKEAKPNESAAITNAVSGGPAASPISKKEPK